MKTLQAVFKNNASHPLLEIEDRVFTFQQVWQQSLLAASFALEKGIKKNDRVGLLMPSNEKSFFYLLGLWMIGATPALISPKSSMVEKINFIKTAGLKTILSPEKLEGETSFEFTPRDIDLIIFTSGSTGAPKALKLSFLNLYFSAKGSNEFYGINEKDIYLLSLPLNHIGGLMVFMRCLLSKAKCIFSSDLESSILKHKPSLISLVPTQLIRLLENSQVKEILKTSKALLIGGDHLPEKYLHDSLPISLTYGLSESTAQVAASKPGEREVKVLPYREVAINKFGQIGIRGKTRFQNYLENGKLVAPFDKGGTFWSQDLGEIVDNTLKVFGRLDDQFICGGENIAPAEIEKALLEIEGIERAKVIPLKNEEYGHVPVAFYRSKNELKDLNILLNKYLPIYKIPKHFLRYVDSEMKWPKDKLAQLAENEING